MLRSYQRTITNLWFKYRLTNLACLGLLISPLLLWVHAQLDYRHGTIGLGLALIQVFGLLALSSFVLSLILSSKQPLINILFPQTDDLYLWHKYTGILASSAMLVHFIAILVINRAQLPSYLIPSFTSTYNWAFFMGQVAYFGIIFLLSLTYIKKIPYHIWKSTHQWMGAFFILGSLHSILISSTAKLSPPFQYYLILLSLTGLLSFAYLKLIWPRSSKLHLYTLSQINRLDQSVLQLSLEPQSGPLRFKPGQFVYLKLVGNSKDLKEVHPFTVASSPLNKKITLAIKDLGDYTAKLKDLKPGQKVQLIGPYGGMFNASSLKSNKVFIAGGIGITPFLSYLSYILDLQKNPQILNNAPAQKPVIDLHYFAHSTQEAQFLDLCQNLSRELQIVKLNIYTHYSELSTLKAEQFCRQYLPKTAARSSFYLCGPKSLMQQYSDCLISSGVKRQKIKMEDFSFK
jgi:predicted ferric reductase